MQDGILLVDKPAGITSFGVVSRIRRILSQERGARVKVGHAGTLDPFATGLLIILVGKATKQADTFLKLDKSYFANLKLGEISSTGDPEGEISSNKCAVPHEETVSLTLQNFEGEVSQIPPAFSAIKINGQRAYKLARQGKVVKIEPRKIKIYSISLVEYNFPQLSFVVNVSSGTYIRSLAGDIGQQLGCGAYLKELRRLSIGKFSIEDACKLNDHTKASELIEKILPVIP